MLEIIKAKIIEARVSWGFKKTDTECLTSKNNMFSS